MILGEKLMSSKSVQYKGNESKKISIEQRSMHLGSILSPEILEQYNQIDHSFAERIISMAEQQLTHIQNSEKETINSRSRNSLLGILCGFLIVLATIVASVILGLKGFIIPSSIIGSGGIIGLAGIFIYGTR
jgi:uncharacterized membrane protein